VAATDPLVTVGAISVASAVDIEARNDSMKNIGTDMKACLFDLLFEARSKGK
jgi:hypothetical protein